MPCEIAKCKPLHQYIGKQGKQTGNCFQLHDMRVCFWKSSINIQNKTAEVSSIYPTAYLFSSARIGQMFRSIVKKDEQNFNKSGCHLQDKKHGCVAQILVLRFSVSKRSSGQILEKQNIFFGFINLMGKAQLKVKYFSRSSAVLLISVPFQEWKMQYLKYQT